MQHTKSGYWTWIALLEPEHHCLVSGELFVVHYDMFGNRLATSVILENAKTQQLQSITVCHTDTQLHQCFNCYKSLHNKKIAILSCSFTFFNADGCFAAHRTILLLLLILWWSYKEEEVFTQEKDFHACSVKATEHSYHSLIDPNHEEQLFPQSSLTQKYKQLHTACHLHTEQQSWDVTHWGLIHWNISTNAVSISRTP